MLKAITIGKFIIKKASWMSIATEQIIPMTKYEINEVYRIKNNKIINVSK